MSTLENFAYIGVDVSKDTLQIAYKDTHQNWIDLTIKNEVSAITRWLAQEWSQPLFVILEHTGNYSCRLLYTLHAQQIAFHVLTGKQSKGFANVLKAIAKTDKHDARNLYTYGVHLKPIPTGRSYFGNT